MLMFEYAMLCSFNIDFGCMYQVTDAGRDMHVYINRKRDMLAYITRGRYVYKTVRN